MSKNKKQQKQNKNITEQQNETSAQVLQTLPPKNFFGTQSSGIAYLCCFIFSIIFSLILSPMAQSNVFAVKVSAYIILQLMFVLVILVVAFLAKTNPFKEWNFKKTAHWSTYIIFAVAMVCVLFCFTMFANVFEFGLKSWGYNITGNNNALVGNNIGELIFAIFAIALLPAIFEELVFRGIILKGAMQYGKTLAVVISALCFAIFHGSIEQTIYQAVLGAMFGLAYVTTGDIKVSMLMHFLNNATVLIYTYFAPAEELLKVAGWQIALAIVLMLIGIAIIWLAMFIVKKFKKEATPLTVVKEEKHSNVWLIIAIFFVTANWIFTTLYGFGINLTGILKGA